MNIDAPRTARKIKREIKGSRPKIIGLSIATCVIAPLPYFGVWVALATGLFAFWLVAKGMLAIHNFEDQLAEAEMSDEEIANVLPSYQPVIVNAAACVGFLIAAAIIASKFAGVVRDLVGDMGLV